MQRCSPAAVRAQLESLARALGFDGLEVAELALEPDEQHLLRWLENGYHGDMGYMARHGLMRSRPAMLAPGSVRAICVRMNYFPDDAAECQTVLGDPLRAYVSRYALGRDYHKVLRGRLKTLAQQLHERIGPFVFRVCVDSAPVLEKALARNAGLGWIGKHTNLLSREAGSWFFLGEILTDLPLPADSPPSQHCGSCTACIHICPPGPSWVRSSWMPGAACPISPSNTMARFRSNCGRRWATASMVAMTASWCARGTNSRAPRRIRTLRCATGWIAHSSRICSSGRRRSLRSACTAQPSIASAMSAGRAILPWHWGMHHALQLVRRTLLARRDQASALLREHIDWALEQHPAPEALSE